VASFGHVSVIPLALDLSISIFGVEVRRRADYDPEGEVGSAGSRADAAVQSALLALLHYTASWGQFFRDAVTQIEAVL
jgi:hypothetical protein